MAPKIIRVISKVPKGVAGNMQTEEKLDVITKAVALEKLRWAIWFCQEELRPGALSDARGDLAEFIECAGPAPLEYREDLVTGKPMSRMEGGKFREVPFLPPEQMATAQAFLKEQFAHLANNAPDLENPISSQAHLFDHALASIGATLSSPAYVFSIASGNLKDKLFNSLGVLLTIGGVRIGQIRSCPDQKCRRMFLLERNPHVGLEYHCSIKCARRAAVRRFRDKEEAKAKERARGRKRYDKKIRSKPHLRKATIAKTRRPET